MNVQSIFICPLGTRRWKNIGCYIHRFTNDDAVKHSSVMWSFGQNFRKRKTQPNYVFVWRYARIYMTYRLHCFSSKWPFRSWFMVENNDFDATDKTCVYFVAYTNQLTLDNDSFTWKKGRRILNKRQRIWIFCTNKAIVEKLELCLSWHVRASKLKSVCRKHFKDGWWYY